MVNKYFRFNNTMTFNERINVFGSYIVNLKIKYFLLIIVLIQFILHIPIFNLPPMGQHVWRQVMGLSMANNYYQEDLNFLESAQDIRIGEDDRGLVYTEFPLIYWLIGKSYHATGFSHINGRLTAFLFSILLIFSSYNLVKLFKYDEVFCRWFVFFLSFTPFFFYYSISLLPNLPSLSLFITGIVLIYPKIKENKWGFRYFMGVALITLATITKQLYLFYGLVLAQIYLSSYFEIRKWQVLISGFFSAIFILFINYILWIYGLEINTNAPIERSSTVQLDVGRLPFDFERYLSITQTAFTIWFLEMFVNTAAIPIFFYGLFLSIKHKKWESNNSGFWITWLISFAVLYFTYIDKFEQHGYYFTSTSVLCALCSTYGMIHLMKHKIGQKIGIFLLVMIPIVMIGRVSHRWIDNKQVPNQLLYSSHDIQTHIPSQDKIIVHGDSTPLVYLYFINRKGLSLDMNNISENQLINYQNKGIKWVLSTENPSNFKALKIENDDNIKKINDFYLLKL